MKKLLISIIAILTIILIGQLIYYRIRGNKTNNNNTNNIIVNNTENKTNEEVKHIEVNETIIENVLVPNKIDVLSRTYKGNIKMKTLEKKLYTFINQNVKNIYNLTSGKSINQILQLYDLKESIINEMNIYSSEDLHAISSQILKIGNIEDTNYSHSNIDMDSYKNDENGYATFNMSFIYKNNKEIKIKVYLANDTNKTPNIKFGKQD